MGLQWDERYFYLHFVDLYGKCRQIYHTWIPLGFKQMFSGMKMIGDKNIKKKTSLSLSFGWRGAICDFSKQGRTLARNMGFYIWTFDVFVCFVCVCV